MQYSKPSEPLLRNWNFVHLINTLPLSTADNTVSYT